ncbi:MAG: hypothetical protein DLM67_14895 [Candidatus Nephthysia bennettiae]|nr:MAG: hypothetical protein DLM67_14895 [Candidatus Dormibacteraeota bacterium]
MGGRGRGLTSNRLVGGEELRRYTRLLLRWSWLLVLCAAVGAGGAFVVTKRQAPVYEATTLMVVDQRGVGQGSYSDVLASNQSVTTYANLIPQPVVVKKAASQVPGVSASSLVGRVKASAQADSSVIEIRVDDTDPARAATLANAVASAFIVLQQQQAQSAFQDAQTELQAQDSEMTARINNLNERIAKLQASNPSSADLPTLHQQLDALQASRSVQEGVSAQLTQQYVITSNNIRIFQPAETPVSPDHPKPTLFATVGGLVGFVVAAGVVLLWGNRLGEWRLGSLGSVFGRRNRRKAEGAWESGTASTPPSP